MTEQKILNKLPRLERLEYEFKERVIKEESPDFLSFVLSGFWYYIFFMAFGITIFYSNYEFGVSFAISMLKMVGVSLLLFIVLGIVSQIMRNKKKKELFFKYFKINKKEDTNGRRKTKRS